MAATNVHFSFKNAQGRPKTGTLHVAPVRRHISGSTVVVLGGFDVALGSDGTATVQLEPTDNTFAWLVREFPDDTDSAFERVVQVPASSSTVEYTSLVDVDKDALTPALNTGAALTYLLASSLQEAQAMSAANPGQMVFYPEGRAKTVASQILEDLTDARAVVEAQSAVAAQAANAAQAATAQVTAVADSITESKTAVESHANEALTAIDEAVKSVQDKASDVTVEDKAKDKTPADATADTTSQEA